MILFKNPSSFKVQLNMNWPILTRQSNFVERELERRFGEVVVGDRHRSVINLWPKTKAILKDHQQELSHAPKNGATKKSYLLNSLTAENLTITNKTLILKVRPYNLSLAISLIDVLQGNLAKFVLAVVRAFLTLVETKVLQKNYCLSLGLNKWDWGEKEGLSSKLGCFLIRLVPILVAIPIFPRSVADTNPNERGDH